MKLTDKQKSVLDVLQKAKEPVGAYELLERLQTSGFNAPVQVYRSLKWLNDHHLIHRLDTLNAYVACSGKNCHQHGFAAFAICDECGHVDEFNDANLRTSLEQWLDSNAFAKESSTIEIHGKCTACTKNTHHERKNANS